VVSDTSMRIDESFFGVIDAKLTGLKGAGFFVPVQRSREGGFLKLQSSGCRL
jgi:hypothetical protein